MRRWWLNHRTLTDHDAHVGAVAHPNTWARSLARAPDQEDPEAGGEADDELRAPGAASACRDGPSPILRSARFLTSILRVAAEAGGALGASGPEIRTRHPDVLADHLLGVASSASSSAGAWSRLSSLATETARRPPLQTRATGRR